MAVKVGAAMDETLGVWRTLQSMPCRLLPWGSGSVASGIPPERISARHISLSKNAGSSNGGTSMDRHDYVPIQFEANKDALPEMPAAKESDDLSNRLAALKQRG